MSAKAKKRLPRQATVEIVDMSHDGRGVARLDGKTVFVAGALQGEQVEIEVEKRRRRYDVARVVTVLDASPDRVTPRCAAFGVCGGSALQHQSIDGQRAAKRGALEAALTRIGEVRPGRWLDDLTGSEWSYRRKARLGVKYVTRKERVLVGFRERLVPYITDMQRCEVLAAPVGELIAPLAELIGGLTIRASLPQIEVAVGDETVALVLRVLQPPSDEDVARLRAFAAANDVDLYLQPGGLDTIAPLTEPRRLCYRLEDFGVTIDFQPADFVQVHGELNARMVRHVADLLDVDGGDRVLDLFCGLGNFTLPLATKAAQVVGVEGDAGLVGRARDNARANAIDNVEFFSADLFAEETTWHWPRKGYDLVLLDPPRSGAQQVIGVVGRSGARRIVYVSCHPGSLARDAGELVREHGFELTAAGIMDMFPHTAHVESVAVFDRG